MEEHREIITVPPEPPLSGGSPVWTWSRDFSFKVLEGRDILIPQGHMETNQDEKDKLPSN